MRGAAEPMGLLFVSSVGELGGGETCLARLVEAVKAEGLMAPLLACPPGALADRVAAAGIPVHLLRVPSEIDPDAALDLAPDGLGLARPQGLGRRTRVAWNLMRSAAAALPLARRARGAHVALVVANSPRAAIPAGIAGRLLGRPVVVHVRDIAHSPFTRPSGRSLLRRLGDAAIAASRATADVVEGTLPVTVVHDGLPAHELVPRHPREPGDPRTPRLAMVAALSPWKGHDIAVRAMPAIRARFPGARLTLHGGDWGRPTFQAYGRRLEQLVAECGVSDAVVLAGATPDIPRHLAACDVLVHPPTQPDPFPGAVIEAAVAGCPIVASRTGGIPEIVEDGVSALLVAPGDPDALARAVLEILLDPARAARMAAAAQVRVRSFTLERQVREVEAVYRPLAAWPA